MNIVIALRKDADNMIIIIDYFNNNDNTNIDNNDNYHKNRTLKIICPCLTCYFEDDLYVCPRAFSNVTNGLEKTNQMVV